MTINYKQTNQLGRQKGRTRDYATHGVWNLNVNSVLRMLIPVLPVVESLPPAANHNPITCSRVCETPAISTNL
jgi:hypothetical protein